MSNDLNTTHHVSVNFDEELGEYKTNGGVNRNNEDPNYVTAPVNMWLKAIDLCLNKLASDGLDFSSLVCISGCAQQHGSVWWRRSSSNLLASMNPDNYLHNALVSAFSLRDSPVWMDSSTSEECKMMERHLGGPERMAEVTGSRAYERFTGAQIAKIFRKRRDMYDITERITLISNFLASIFLGSYAPFDISDASGMNLMDLKTGAWSESCVAAALDGDKSEIDNLKSKLGSEKTDHIVDTARVVGGISDYFVKRYGFNRECKVSSFTGDNPGSFAGLNLAKNELFLSLGTSDTSCFWIDEPSPRINGHVLRNPIDPSKYMGLVCYKNGSLTRERIRDKCASGDWDKFSQLLNSVPRGNFGNIGFYFDLREIHPLVKGDFRFNKLDQRVEAFLPEIEIRACLEGQFLRLLHHSEQLGLKIDEIDRVLVTGGASANRAILEVVADVFRRPVFTIDMPNTACLGAAYLAKYSIEREEGHNIDSSTFQQIVFSGLKSGDKNLKKVADPTPIASIDVYLSLLKRYIKLEESIIANNPNN